MKVFKVALSIFSIICTIIGITSFTVLQILDKSISKEHVISKLEEIKIYDQIYDEVQSGFEEYIYQSGLEAEMFEDICTKEKIQNDLMSIIDSIYEGKEAIIDTSIIKQNLDNKINNYVNATDATAISVKVRAINTLGGVSETTSVAQVNTNNGN